MILIALALWTLVVFFAGAVWAADAGLTIKTGEYVGARRFRE